MNLPRFDLSQDKDSQDWVLREVGAPRARRRFENKSDATAAGVLREAGRAVEGRLGRSRKLHADAAQETVELVCRRRMHRQFRVHDVGRCERAKPWRPGRGQTIRGNPGLPSGCPR